MSLKEWTRNRNSAQIIVLVGLAASVLMHFPHFTQYRVIKRPCEIFTHPLDPVDVEENIDQFPQFERAMCYEKRQSCATRSTVWTGYNYVFQVLARISAGVPHAQC